MADYANEQPSPHSTLRRVLSNERAAGQAYAAEATELRDLWSDEEKLFMKIGAGACGEVYQMSGSEGVRWVVKRAKTEQFALQLWDDYRTHLQVVDALAQRRGELEVDVLVPEVREFAGSEETQWWTAHGDKFPREIASRLPAVSLVSERVMPIPVEARNALISLFCPENRQQAARNDPGNLDCLVRLYLGKRRPERRTRSTVNIFGLRNYQLYLDDMETMRLDTAGYAVKMAKTLALMHWEVRCDANDVEFVLGGARERSGKRAVDLWMIDFNRVRSISMDGRGIETAVDAFMVNDRYYPRPLDKTETGERQWAVFKEAYLEASKRLQGAQRAEGKAVDWEGLPERFIEAVVGSQGKLLREKAVAMDRD